MRNKMRISKIIMVYLLLFFSLSNSLAQSTDHKGFTIQNNIKSDVLLFNSKPQDWELIFSYNLLDTIGSSQFAGIVYEPSWDELWISSWARGDIRILKLSETSIYQESNLLIDGVSLVRGMTTDGEFIYAGNASDTIKVLDFYYELVGEIIAPVNVRYITYDPDADGGNGGFWVGSWTTDPTLIDKNGNFIRSLDYANLGTSSIYGGAYDILSDGGPFLWLWGRGLGGGNPQNIVQINPTTGLPTGVYHDVTSDIGVQSDSLVSGGLFITNQLFNDKIILGGILQGNGDYVFGYDITSSIIITGAPYAITKEATNISSTSVTLNGTLNPNGPTTSYLFELGTSTSYGTTVNGTSSFAGSMDFDVSADVTDLSPNTTYHYRLKATNSDGIDYGSDKTFTTTAEGNPPSVTTNAATNIGTTTATLNGTINPNGLTTAYFFAYGTSTTYDNFEPSLVGLNGSDPIQVNVNISGLNPNTLYHFVLSAGNDDGDTYGNDVTFTTASEGNMPPLANTSAATNVGTTTATLNGIINPNGSTTTYIFEYGASTGYGNSIAGTSSLTGSVNVNVNEDITGLSPNSTYHFRLSATNEGGTTLSDDATFMTSSSSTDIDLQWKTLSVLSFDWEVGSSITADLMVKNNGTSSSPSHESQLFLSSDNIIESSDVVLGSQISFPAISAGDSITVASNFTVPAIASGIYYFGAIVDINNSIIESNESNNSNPRKGKVIIGYPTTIQLNSSVSFNDASESSSFRMVGLPGSVNQSISQYLSGSYNEDWVAYYDNGSNTDYLVAYDGSNTFDFSPGKGFWLLSKNNLSINKSVNAVNIQNNFVSSGTYEIVYPITLHSGWNIISNPFETDVSWNSVQSFNQITESIHSFNGSFSSSTVMEPYNGYYFYNVTNLQTIQIPYSVNSSLTKEVTLKSEDTQNLELSAVNKNNQTSSIVIGFDQDAHSGYDKYDQFIPPGDFDDIRISIMNKQIETPYQYLQADYREYDKNHSYEIFVKNEASDLLELVFKGIETIVADAVFLVDNNLAFHDLRSSERIYLKSTKSLNKIQLLIGNYEFIESNRTLLVPKSYSLNQNYPNPFNPSTTIEYTIPENTTVEIKLFNTLGEEIQTLVNEVKAPGKYEVLFEAKDLTSGVYLYRINSGDFVETKKMIFMK